MPSASRSIELTQIKKKAALPATYSRTRTCEKRSEGRQFFFHLPKQEEYFLQNGSAKTFPLERGSTVRCSTHQKKISDTSSSGDVTWSHHPPSSPPTKKTLHLGYKTTNNTPPPPLPAFQPPLAKAQKVIALILLLSSLPANVCVCLRYVWYSKTPRMDGQQLAIFFAIVDAGCKNMTNWVIIFITAWLNLIN